MDTLTAQESHRAGNIRFKQLNGTKLRHSIAFVVAAGEVHADKHTELCRKWIIIARIIVENLGHVNDTLLLSADALCLGETSIDNSSWRWPVTGIYTRLLWGYFAHPPIGAQTPARRLIARHRGREAGRTGPAAEPKKTERVIPQNPGWLLYPVWTGLVVVVLIGRRWSWYQGNWPLMKEIRNNCFRLAHPMTSSINYESADLLWWSFLYFLHLRK